MAKAIYLDHAATTPVHPKVLEAMLPYLRESFGNPSGIYSVGREARRAIDRARDTVVQVLGCKSNEIIFTSCGTESDNLAIRGVAMALKDKGNHIVTSQVEHHAVLHTCQWLEKHLGFQVTYLPVDRYGMVSVEELERAITDRTVLVSLMLANNEVGTIQPVSEAARVLRGKGIVFHTDAVQCAGALDLNVDDLGVNLLSLSAHKFYAPKGVGILYIRRGTPLVPQQTGGSQERNTRAGTENVPYIVAAATALRIAHENLEASSAHCRALRDRLVQGIAGRLEGVHLTGHPSERLPNNASFALEALDGESLILSLDMQGVCASSGSACSAGSLEPSYVLKAMGLPTPLAQNALRLTVGHDNTTEEIEEAIEKVVSVVSKLRGVKSTAARSAAASADR